MKRINSSYRMILYIIVFYIISFIFLLESIPYSLYIPVFLILFLTGINKQSMVLTSFGGLVFLTYGLDPFFFKLFQKYYTTQGFSSVGKYNFTYISFLDSYIPSCLFVLFLFILSSMFINSSKRFYSLIKKLDKLSIKYKGRNKNSLLFFLLLIFTAITIFMYKYRIGVTGCYATIQLPFKLAGLFYYVRLFLVPIIILRLSLSSSNKNYLFLFIYALIAGLTSSSKQVFSITMFSIFLSLFIKKQKKLLVLSIIFYIFGTFFITASRSILYYSERYISLSELIIKTYNILRNSSFIDVFIYPIALLTNRLYGVQYCVLSNQYASVNSFSEIFWNYNICGNFIHFYSNPATQIFNFTIDSQYGFGVSVGFIAELFLLCQKNISILIFELLWFSLLLFLLESCYQIICTFLPKLQILMSFFVIYMIFMLWCGRILFFNIGLISLLIFVCMLYSIKLTIKASYTIKG